MKKLRWPLLIVLLALAAIGVLLLSQSNNPIILPVPFPTPQIKPATGGVYTEGLVGSLSRLNPILDLYNSPDHDADRLLFSGLIHFDDRGIPVADLAESWGISQDGKVYNFSLRKNATWHDGKPVTADDVIFTIDMLRDDNSIVSDDVRNLWKDVDVTALDDTTLQFRLPEPFAPFLDYLAFGILPQHLLDGKSMDEIVNDSFNLSPIGSGPYRFERLIVENGKIAGVVLSAYKDYYGQKPFIQQFIFRYYPDSQAMLAAYKKGDIKGMGQVPEDILPQVLKEPGLSIHTGRLPKLTLVFMNLNNPDVPFFGDASIRRALLMGTNRQWLVDRVMNGQAIIADGPIFPGTWAYYDGTEHVNYDSQAAIDMIKTAGYTIPAEGGSVRTNKDGKKLAFELLYPDDPTHTEIAGLLQKNWEALGFQVTLTPMAYDELLNNNLETRSYQAALVDLNLVRLPDPDPYPFWHQTQGQTGQNYSRWDDLQASEYLERARVTTNLDERAKEYRNFQVRFAEQLPALTLYYPVYSYAIDPAVQGVSMGPLFDFSDRFATVTSWYLMEARATQAPSQPTATSKP